MARLIGEAYVMVYPNVDQFGPRTQAGVTRALSAVRGDVPINPDLNNARMLGIIARIKNLAGAANIGLTLDPAAIAKIEAQLKALGGNMVLKAQLDALSVAQAKLDLDAAFNKSRPLLIKADLDPASVAAARTVLDAAFGHEWQPVITPVLSAATLAALRAAVNTGLNNPATQLQLNTMSAMAKIAALGAYAKGVMGNIALGLSGMVAANLTLAGLTASLAKMTATANASAAAADALTSVWALFISGTGAGFGVLNNKISLFAGALRTVLPAIMTTVSGWHLLVDWVVEFAAVLIPATLGVAAFGAAIAPVVADAVKRFQEMQQAASALGVSIGILNYNAQGAVGPMQALQNKLQPTVWELTGDAIRVMTANTGAFQKVVTAVNTVVLQLATRMTQAFTSKGAGDFMANAALDFQRFGTIIGNLGGAIGNILKDVPGYAEVIQELFVKLSAGIEAFTAFAGPVIKAGLALHGFFVYVGLAVTAGVALVGGLASVITKLFAFAAASTDLSAVLAAQKAAWTAAGASITAFGKNLLALALNPYIIAIAALGAAVYLIVTNWNAASASVANYTRNMEQAIATMSGGDAVQQIALDFGALTASMKEAGSPQAVAAINANWQNLGNAGNRLSKDIQLAGQNFAAGWKALTTSPGGALEGATTAVKDFGTAFLNIFGGSSGFQQEQAVALQVKDNIGNLQTAFNQLTNEQKNLFTVTGQLMTGFTLGNTSTYTWAQSLGILNAAGVQAGDTLSAMQTKVQGFLAGWQQFGLNASQVGNAVNALALQSEMGQSSLSKLTGAYTNFISVVTGGETSLATFGTGLGTLNSALNSANTTGVTFRDTLGKFEVTGTSVGASLNGISQASLNVRSAFAQEITNATGLYNSLLTMSTVSADGAKGQNTLAQAMKDMIASLLPLAKGSTTAVSELSSLAQIAGGPATDSFATLSKWVGNVQNPMQNLNSIEQQLTKQSANLLQDTLNLAGAMNQTLTTAMGNAVFAAEKGPAALQNLADAMASFTKGGTSITTVASDLAKLIPTLNVMTGSTANSKDMFLSLAGALNISQADALAMWNAATKVSPALQQAANNAATFANATAINKATLADVTSLLGQSSTAYDNLWKAILQTDNGLVANTSQANLAKNAFIDFAKNGLDMSSSAAQNLWKTSAAQNLTALAGKAGTTEGAFVSMAKNGLNLSTADATQLWNTLRLQYLDELATKASTTEGDFVNLAKSGLGLTDSQAQQLWTTLRNQYLDTLAAKAGETESAFQATAAQFGVAADKAKALWDQLHAMPTSLTIPVDIPISMQITQAQGPNGVGAGGLSNSIIAQLGASLGAASGGVAGVSIPHFGPGGTVRGHGASGRDSQIAVLAPGELVIPTSHAPMFGDMAKKAGIPGFAGGVYGVGGFRSPYSYASAPTMTADVGIVSGGDPLSRFALNKIAMLLDQQNKLLAQQPYAYAQALAQGTAQGVRRGYFATSG